MNKFKKIGVLFSTLALAFSVMAMPVFAASIDNGVAESSDTQLTIPKGVTFINADAVTSYGPGITFTYTVAPATVASNVTVTDKNNHSTTVHEGPAGGLTLASSSLTFSSTETFTTSAAGVQATKDIVLDVDISKFERPGVYRYVVTDTTAKADLYSAGITRDDNYDTTRYVDVFVKRNTSRAMEVYGYALKVDNTTTTASSDKDPGFVSESKVEDGDPANTDRYETYNVTLTKQVEGTLGDYQHEFPFAITVSNDGKNYYAAKGDITAAKAATPDAVTSKTTTLKHTQVYTLAGLSPHATVAYVETNDTTDLYAVTAAGSTNAISVTADNTAKTYAVAAGAVSSYDTANSALSVNDLGETTNYSAVTYTNTLDEVSPTGLIQHYGPFMALFMAALSLMFVARRLREE